jgi:hypothetical protein
MVMQQSADLVRELADVLAEMQRIQSKVAADAQPVSMHELDALKRLGVEYSVLIARLAKDERTEREQGDPKL